MCRAVKENSTKHKEKNEKRFMQFVCVALK